MMLSIFSSKRHGVQSSDIKLPRSIRLAIILYTSVCFLCKLTNYILYLFELLLLLLAHSTIGCDELFLGMCRIVILFYSV